MWRIIDAVNAHYGIPIIQHVFECQMNEDEQADFRQAQVHKYQNEPRYLCSY